MTWFSNIAKDQSNITTRIPLGFWTCFFIDIPDNVDSKEIISPEQNSNATVYSCFFRHEYFAGEIAGPIICTILCALTALVGLIGVCSNVLNICVLLSQQHSSFGKLLVILAGFDLFVCLFVFFTTILLQLILNNVSRSAGMLWTYKSCFLLYSLGRTGSIFITILITIERYFVIAHHFKAKLWLTTRRRIILTLICLILIFFISLPWWFNATVVSLNINEFSTGALSKYPAVFVTTYFGTNIYFPTWFRPIHNFINLVLPLPLLLLFNGLLYKFIYNNWNKSRGILSSNKRRDREVKTAKMFSVIVLVLFSCHTFGVINFLVADNYRDLVLSVMFTVTLNSAINFFVYYAFGEDFRKQFWLKTGSKMCSTYFIKNIERNCTEKVNTSMRATKRGEHASTSSTSPNTPKGNMNHDNSKPTSEQCSVQVVEENTA